MLKWIRDFAIAVSVSNLLFGSAWRVLLSREKYKFYHWKQQPGFTEVAALCLDIVLLALLFLLLAHSVRRLRSHRVTATAHVLFMALFLIPLNDVRLYEASGWMLWFRVVAGNLSANVAIAVVAISWIVISFVWRTQLFHKSEIVSLILLPLLAINVIQVVLPITTARREWKPVVPSDVALSSAPNRLEGRRVVWIVFDMLDQRAAFLDRPAEIEMPEFDRLRQHSVFATNAYPPAVTTQVTMPSLITGQLITEAKRSSSSNLLLTFPGPGGTGMWSDLPNVFGRAQALGAGTALVGWYHPYCRVLGKNLNRCLFEPIVDDSNPGLANVSLVESMFLSARRSAYSIPFGFRLLERWHERDKLRIATERHELLLAESRSIAADPAINLALLHLSVPHYPAIYNAKTNSIVRERETTYQDNLELADITLGELRRAMEAAGTWDQTTVIISSDHWWRESPMINGRRDHRIPFIVKLAAERDGRTFETAFNTVVTADLILAILRGDLRISEQAVEFLDNHRQIAESPSTINIP